MKKKTTRIAALLSAAAMLSLSLSGALVGVAEGEIIKGDVDLDGQVNLGDYACCMRCVTGEVDVTEERIMAGDMNGDGMLTVADAAMLFASLNGENPSPAAGDPGIAVYTTDFAPVEVGSQTTFDLPFYFENTETALTAMSGTLCVNGVPISETDITLMNFSPAVGLRNIFFNPASGTLAMNGGSFNPTCSIVFSVRFPEDMKAGTYEFSLEGLTFADGCGNSFAPVKSIPCTLTFTESGKVDPPVESQLYGDVNGDGTVDLADQAILLNYLRYGSGLARPENADVNLDGVIDDLDAHALYYYVNGKLDLPFAGEPVKMDTSLVERIRITYADATTGTRITDALSGGNYMVKPGRNAELVIHFDFSEEVPYGSYLTGQLYADTGSLVDPYLYECSSDESVWNSLTSIGQQGWFNYAYMISSDCDRMGISINIPLSKVPAGSYYVGVKGLYATRSNEQYAVDEKYFVKLDIARDDDNPVETEPVVETTAPQTTAAPQTTMTAAETTAVPQATLLPATETYTEAVETTTAPQTTTTTRQTTTTTKEETTTTTTTTSTTTTTTTTTTATTTTTEAVETTTEAVETTTEAVETTTEAVETTTEAVETTTEAVETTTEAVETTTEAVETTTEAVETTTEAVETTTEAAETTTEAVETTTEAVETTTEAVETTTETAETTTEPGTTETTPGGDEGDLPQTGRNSLDTMLAFGGAVSVTVAGMWAVLQSGVLRRKRDE